MAVLRSTMGITRMVALMACLIAAVPAVAEQPGSSGPFRRTERPAENGVDPRQALQRGEQPPPRQAGWPVGQMSPEERRQLRRDIDQHGRDLYKERRERR